jgi:hypothetical protein
VIGEKKTCAREEGGVHEYEEYLICNWGQITQVEMFRPYYGWQIAPGVFVSLDGCERYPHDSKFVFRFKEMELFATLAPGCYVTDRAFDWHVRGDVYVLGRFGGEGWGYGPEQSSWDMELLTGLAFYRRENYEKFSRTYERRREQSLRWLIKNFPVAYENRSGRTEKDYLCAEDVEEFLPKCSVCGAVAEFPVDAYSFRPHYDSERFLDFVRLAPELKRMKTFREIEHDYWEKRIHIRDESLREFEVESLVCSSECQIKIVSILLEERNLWETKVKEQVRRLNRETTHNIRELRPVLQCQKLLAQTTKEFRRIGEEESPDVLASLRREYERVHNLRR